MSRKGRHRRFADSAGFTHHCWECAHAGDWQGGVGRCDAYGMPVDRYDSPYNCCSVARGCESYMEPMGGGRKSGC